MNIFKLLPKEYKQPYVYICSNGEIMESYNILYSVEALLPNGLILF